MSKHQKKVVPINYTNREFETIRNDLIELAERLYPDSFQDFSEASFASLMVDAVSYIGDQLSFYLDYNVNEAFLDTAYQYNNILRHGRVMGYKHTGRPSTFGKTSMFILVPASPTGLGPDKDYIPVLKKGTQFSTAAKIHFTLMENIDFSDPRHTVVVARVDDSTGAPTHYAIKAYGNVISGAFATEKINIGDYERFRRVRLQTGNVSEIISVFDESGNEYFQVSYLAQDMVYKEVANTNHKNDNVPSIIKPFLVSRKFVVEHERQNTFLQFGSGKAGQTDVVADPQSVAMDIFGKNYVTDTSFDPTRLSKNDSFGIVPSNTSLIVTLRTTNPINSNVAAGQLNEVTTALFQFKNQANLVTSKLNTVRRSLEVNNEVPIIGDVTNPTSAEVKQRIYDTFPTQNRAVTQSDYESIAYRMPGQFGSIKRCSVQRDPDSEKRNLNFYVISEDPFGSLIETNNTIKKNLKIWLNEFRMINDTIDILDPFILNFGIVFSIKTKSGVDKYGTLQQCVSALTEHYEEGFFIGESFSVSEIYAKLKSIEGVLDVLKVKVVNKTDTSYSGASIDIDKNTSPDGNMIVIPKNAIVEIKFPGTDIVGTAR
ncbi:MAG: hypothetical protein CMF52_03370 [Legionellales bacterium]|nr:hypothetical protein [Legionellales bacterium]